jgi:hypothetical protein
LVSILPKTPPILNGDVYLQPLNMVETVKLQQEDQLKDMADKIYLKNRTFKLAIFKLPMVD